MSRVSAHNKLRDEILVALSQAGFGVFWSNETGVAFRDDAPIRYGCLGSADIIGCAYWGKFVGIEVKTGKAKQSERQLRWSDAIRKAGGVVIVARSVEQTINDLKIALDLDMR